VKTRYLLALVLSAAMASSYGQQAPSWQKWKWLMGAWAGEGNGQPGKGSGNFSFATDLENKILVRKANSQYPAQGNRPASVHDDLLIIYADISGSPSKAIYFDNEGHVINYSVTYPGESIVFQSEKLGNMPVFRLTYSAVDDQTINTKFEMSQDGAVFMTYVEGKSRKVK